MARGSGCDSKTHTAASRGASTPAQTPAATPQTPATAPTELIQADWYGSLSEETYREVVAAHPFWFHVTPRENLASILTEGLRAGEPRLYYTEKLESRPGCVYLMDDAYGEGCWEATGLDPETGVMIAVDLRQIERERILPDEDDFSTEMYGAVDPRAYGLPRSDEGTWASTGSWAEEIRLGEQPGVCDEAFRAAKVAIRGTIAPELLRVCDVDPEAAGDSLSRWVKRQLEAELTGAL